MKPNHSPTSESSHVVKSTGCDLSNACGEIKKGDLVYKHGNNCVSAYSNKSSNNSRLSVWSCSMCQDACIISTYGHLPTHCAKNKIRHGYAWKQVTAPPNRPKSLKINKRSRNSVLTFQRILIEGHKYLKLISMNNVKGIHELSKEYLLGYPHYYLADDKTSIRICRGPLRTIRLDLSRHYDPKDISAALNTLRESGTRYASINKRLKDSWSGLYHVEI